MPRRELDQLLSRLERDPHQWDLWPRLLALGQRAGGLDAAAAAVLEARARCGSRAGEAGEGERIATALYQAGFGLGDPSLQFATPVVQHASSRDGSRVALATRGGAALLFDTLTGAQLVHLEGEGPLYLRFAADGTTLLLARLATEGKATTLTLHAIPTEVGKAVSGSLGLSLAGPGEVSDLAADGSRVLLAGRRAGLMLVEPGPWPRWAGLAGRGKAKAERILPPAGEGRVYRGQISPDGRWVLARGDSGDPCGGPESVTVQLLDLETREWHDLPERPWVEPRWSWSPDGLWLVADWLEGSQRHLLFHDPFLHEESWQTAIPFGTEPLVWSVQGQLDVGDLRLDPSRRLTRKLPGPSPAPALGARASLDPSGRLVRILGPEQQILLGSPEHAAPISSLAAASGWLASWDPLGGAALWDLRTGLLAGRWPAPEPSRAGGVALSADGLVLLIARRRGVLVVDRAQERELLWDEVWMPHWGEVRSVALAPDGSRFAVGTSQGHLLTADACTGARLAELVVVEGEAVIACGFPTRDGPALGLGEPGPTRSAAPDWPRPRMGVPPTAFPYPDLAGLIVDGPRGPCLVRATGRDPELLLPGHTPLHPLALAPDGRELAGVKSDGTVVRYDLAPAQRGDRKAIASFKPTLAEASALAYSPDGHWLFYAQLAHIRMHPRGSS